MYRHSLQLQVNSHSFQLLSNEITHNEPLENDTIETLSEKLETLLHIRHDLLQTLVCDCLGIESKFGDQQRLFNIFDGMPDAIGRLSPDIVHVNGENVHIYDPTITVKGRQEQSRKVDKYQPVVDYLTENGYIATFTALPKHPSQSIESFLDIYGFRYDQRQIGSYNTVGKQLDETLGRLKSLQPDRGDLGTDSYNRVFLDNSQYSEIIDSSDLGKTMYSRFDNWEPDDSVVDVIIDLAEDDAIASVLEDTRNDKELLESHFNSIVVDDNTVSQFPKPTYHILHVAPEEIPKKVKGIGDYMTDQQNILHFLEFCQRSSQKGVSSKFDFLIDIYTELTQALTADCDVAMFKTGFYTGSQATESDIKCRIAGINKTRSRDQIQKGMSGKVLREELSQTGRSINIEKPYIGRSRGLSVRPLVRNQEFFKDAGDNYKENHPEGRDYHIKPNCSQECHKDFDSFYNFVSEPINPVRQFDETLNMPIGADSGASEILKTDFKNHFKRYYALISKTRVHQMAYHTHLIAKQIIHYNGINTKNDSFYFLNSGLPNLVHVLKGGQNDRSHDVGRPFFSVAYTKDVRWASNVFGKFDKVPFKGGAFIITGWRRLPSLKLSVLADNYYSTLSTGFDTYLRVELHENKMISYLKFIYCFRCLVGLNTSQRCAELLMDVRYLVMSFCSLYTDVATLIKDKFGPPYPNCFSRWIVNQLRMKSSVVSEKYTAPGSFIRIKPKQNNQGRRDLRTTGGFVTLPSIWTDYYVSDIQGMFDELFVYVHTMKEPSSVFHESIKSLKTIMKYQDEYDGMSMDEKIGNHTAESFKQFILSGKQVGFWNEIVAFSAFDYSRRLSSKDFSQAVKEHVTNEPISKIVSTKAVIPEYERTKPKQNRVPRSKRRDATEERCANQLRDYLLSINEEILDIHEYQTKDLKDVLTESPILEETMTGRTKVHDALLDFLIRNPDASNVIDASHWNMFRNSARVDAHYCIKAQYGPKREFYVVNFGAKCMVRTYESIYKSIAQQVSEEMISIPGDEKLKYLDTLSNEALKATDIEKVYYCNGDCTKWSACETMGSFMSMAAGLRDFTGDGPYHYSLALLSSWAKKRIYIPDKILKGVKFITEKSKYLRDGVYRDSSQNFMQGMFNYSSSNKAVFATELAFKAYSKRHPGTLSLKHLEHSDDYVLVMRTHDVKYVRKFRVYHKLVQKMHGINDSSKKTNIQEYILEFISLMAFNGHMAYPHIKKTKEVGLNIASEGYQRDIMNAISRSTESVRLGVPLASCYIQQYIQSVNIYKAYALDGRNKTIAQSDPYNWPIELYGLPDCLPLAHVCTTAEMNAYRLYIYSNNDMRQIIKGLYYLGRSDEIYSYDTSMLLSNLYSPVYKVSKTGNKVKKIREKVGWTFERARQFIEDNPEYMVMKPNDPLILKNWLKYMYFNRSFCKAYTKISRPNLLLQISYMVSGECIEILGSESMFTMVEYHNYILKLVRRLGSSVKPNDPSFLNTLTGSDSSAQIFYRLMDGATVYKTPAKPYNATAGKLPKTSYTNSLVNNITDIIQYMVSEDRFINDNRQLRSPTYLQPDIEVVQKLVDKPSYVNIIDLFKTYSLSKAKSAFGMTMSEGSDASAERYFMSTIEENSYYGNRMTIIPAASEEDIIDYKTGDVVHTVRFGTNKSKNTIILDNLCQLYYFYNIKMNLEPDRCATRIRRWTISGKPVDEAIKEINFSELSKNIYDMRSLAFMSHLLNKSNTMLDNLLKSGCFYAKEFLDKGTEYSSHPSVKISTKSHTAIGFKEGNAIFIIVKNTNFSIIKQLYIMMLNALGLASLVTMTELLNGKRVLTILPCENPRSDIRNCTHMRIALAGKTHIKVPEAGGNYLPIFFSGKRLGLAIDKNPVRYTAEYRFGRQDPSICIGSVKAFTLPLLPTNETFLLKPPEGEIDNDNVPLKIFCNHGILHRYLTGKSYSSDLDTDVLETLTPQSKTSLTERLKFPSKEDIRSHVSFIKKQEGFVLGDYRPQRFKSVMVGQGKIDFAESFFSKDATDSPTIEGLREESSLPKLNIFDSAFSDVVNEHSNAVSKLIATEEAADTLKGGILESRAMRSPKGGHKSPKPQETRSTGTPKEPSGGVAVKGVSKPGAFVFQDDDIYECMEDSDSDFDALDMDLPSMMPRQPVPSAHTESASTDSTGEVSEESAQAENKTVILLHDDDMYECMEESDSDCDVLEMGLPGMVTLKAFLPATQGFGSESSASIPLDLTNSRIVNVPSNASVDVGAQPHPMHLTEGCNAYECMGDSDSDHDVLDVVSPNMGPKRLVHATNMGENALSYIVLGSAKEKVEIIDILDEDMYDCIGDSENGYSETQELLKGPTTCQGSLQLSRGGKHADFEGSSKGKSRESDGPIPNEMRSLEPDIAGTQAFKFGPDFSIYDQDEEEMIDIFDDEPLTLPDALCGVTPTQSSTSDPFSTETDFVNIHQLNKLSGMLLEEDFFYTGHSSTETLSMSSDEDSEQTEFYTDTIDSLYNELDLHESSYTVARDVANRPSLLNYVYNSWVGKHIESLIYDDKLVFEMVKLCLVMESSGSFLDEHPYQRCCLLSMRSTLLDYLDKGQIKKDFLITKANRRKIRIQIDKYGMAVTKCLDITGAEDFYEQIRDKSVDLNGSAIVMGKPAELSEWIMPSGDIGNLKMSTNFWETVKQFEKSIIGLEGLDELCNDGFVM